MSEIYFEGFWRMDWGFGNPNKTAAFIAMLMIAVWFLVYAHRRGFWVALVLFTGLGMGLIHTFSRGGMLGAMAGLAVVIWKLPRPWPRRRLLGIGASVCLMLGSFFLLQAPKRFGQGVLVEDRSITNRLEVWSAAPRMMADAPDGWGWSRAGEAYMQWYQPVDRHESYRTLVNSHLTWLVEFGWPLRYCYLFAWLAIFIFCWPATGRRAIACGVWIAFAVTAFFSSVAESPWLWIVPALSLLIALADRTACMCWPRVRHWGFAGGASACMALGLFLLGGGNSQVRKVKEGIILGEEDPQIWMIMDPKILGKDCGRTLRGFWESGMTRERAVGIMDSSEHVPHWAGKTVIISGTVANREALLDLVSRANKVIFINPDFLPQEAGFPRESAEKIMAFFGEFSQSPVMAAWMDYTDVSRVEGAGDFLPPKWLAFVLEEHIL